MMTRRGLLGSLALGCLAPALLPSLTGCSSASAAASIAQADQPRAAADAAALADAVRALNAFSTDVYRAARGAGGPNLVCSPLSMAFALGMTVQGARGRTASEMLTVLHADQLGAPKLAAGLNALDLALASRAGQVPGPDGTPQTIELALANSLWGQRDLRWEAAFLDVLARDFGTGMRQVDYRTAAEAARTAINSWVATQTKGKITDLIAQGILTTLTRLVLVNALYLKAPWAIPFEPQSTRQEPFHRATGGDVRVPMMHAELDLPYRRGPGWQAVRLPYADQRLAMTVIVPDAGRLAAVETLLDGAWLAQLLGDPVGGQGEVASVRLALPRWTSRTRLDLTEVLKQLGMPTAFTDAADFSAMTTQERLLISAVVHQGYIAVTEQGTEAAAATAVVMRTTSMPAQSIDLIVDRPFLYVVHDVASAAPLFVGRVGDPSAVEAS